MSKHTETQFESEIAAYLLANGGYAEGEAKSYDKQTALFPSDVLAFVQATQP